MRNATGLDVLVADDFKRLRGKSIGVLCNQASVAHGYRHVLDLLAPLHAEGALKVRAVFGPEHGLYGHTQDNMIEWEGVKDSRTGFTIHSLYGENRAPTPAMLEGIELFVVDLPDVGSRYYTFVWSMALCMEACAKAGIPVLVLDRPNPIGGVRTEGTLLRPGFESFVGLHPVPTRHGMTVGEIAVFVRDHALKAGELEVEKLQGWSRSDYFDDLDIPWVMPSPNMPTLDTALVYPGGCLLEATNLSEGRGTTRPFEIFGAPFIDGWKLAEVLNRLDLPGVVFRPMPFEPTFNKHAGRLCEGCFVHVTDRAAFEPVLTYAAILQETIRQVGMADPAEVAALPPSEAFQAASPETTLAKFCWKRPPYEYEYDTLPMDILGGGTWLREAIEGMTPLLEIRQRFLAECAEFEPTRKACLLYPSA